jgi:hypothetical protein
MERSKVDEGTRGAITRGWMMRIVSLAGCWWLLGYVADDQVPPKADMDVTNRATRFPEATSLEPITLVTTMGMQRMGRKGDTGLGPVLRDIVRRAVGFASIVEVKRLTIL